jgi:hypothetical protein
MLYPINHELHIIFIIAQQPFLLQIYKHIRQNDGGRRPLRDFVCSPSNVFFIQFAAAPNLLRGPWETAACVYATTTRYDE